MEINNNYNYEYIVTLIYSDNINSIILLEDKKKMLISSELNGTKILTNFFD